MLSEHVVEKHRIELADTLLRVYLEFQGMGSLKESIPSVTAIYNRFTLLKSNIDAGKAVI